MATSDRVQEAFGHGSQAHGVTCGAVFAGPGARLNDPCGSLPTQGIL